MGKRDWEPAQATVKARRDSSRLAMGSMNTRSRYEYAMEIVPSGTDAPFTTTMLTPMFVDRWAPLQEGNVVTVLHRPGTQEVRWDRSEPSTSRRAVIKADKQGIKQSDDAAFEAALGPGHEPEP